MHVLEIRHCKLGLAYSELLAGNRKTFVLTLCTWYSYSEVMISDGVELDVET